MKITVTVALGLFLFLAGTSAAQAQDPNMRPTISPWLNLNRFGQSPALNYQTLVRPEFETRAGIAQLQQQNRTDQQAISGLQNAANTPLVTGHQAGFMTQGLYFQTIGGGSPGGSNTNRPAATRRN
jgi:hypothetical protein